MPFVQIFQLYCTFMESNALRHQDLVKPIREYAQSINKSASWVLSYLQSNYRRV